MIHSLWTFSAASTLLGASGSWIAAQRDEPFDIHVSHTPYTCAPVFVAGAGSGLTHGAQGVRCGFLSGKVK